MAIDQAAPVLDIEELETDAGTGRSNILISAQAKIRTNARAGIFVVAETKRGQKDILWDSVNFELTECFLSLRMNGKRKDGLFGHPKSQNLGKETTQRRH